MDVPVSQSFQYCPRCGVQSNGEGGNPFCCAACDYTLFFGPVSAVAGIVTVDDGQVLFLRRQHDPGRGKLGLPGGFIDPGESAEEALRREVREEVNLELKGFQYLCSFPNNYHYKGLIISVTDLFFVCEADSLEAIAAASDEVDSFFFSHPTSHELDQMIFPSNRRAVELFLVHSNPGRRGPYV